LPGQPPGNPDVTVVVDDRAEDVPAVRVRQSLSQGSTKVTMALDDPPRPSLIVYEKVVAV
jgi:hypothetical protein